MALVVAAQVTLTAELWDAHSPDGIVGREALLPIIPACKSKKAETQPLETYLACMKTAHFIC